MRTPLLMAWMAVIALQAYPQTQYYSDGKQIFIDQTLTFECSSTSIGYILTNIHDFDYTSRNEIIPDDIDDFYASDITRRNTIFPNDNAVMNAFYETFTQAEIDQMTGKHMGLHFIYDNDGKIVNLSLDFDNSMASIPPQKYASLYKKIKNNLTFKVTEKKLYYYFISFDLILDRVRLKQRLFHPDFYPQ